MERRITAAMAVAMAAGVFGVRERPERPYGSRLDPTIPRAERERRKAKKKQAERSRRRNRKGK